MFTGSIVVDRMVRMRENVPFDKVVPNGKKDEEDREDRIHPRVSMY